MESKGKETPSTIEALTARLEQQQAQIAALQEARDSHRHIGPKITQDDPRSKITRTDHPQPGGGYVVAMARPWNGTRMGVQFRNGVGIIPEEHPKCDELAHWLEADYHYEVTSATEEELNRIRKALEGVPAAAREQTAAEKLLPSGRVGAVTR